MNDDDPIEFDNGDPIAPDDDPSVPPFDHCREWTVEALVERMKAEIERDFKDGTLPHTVRTFSALHDHVDANEYGGLCDGDCPFDAGTDQDADLINEATGIVDEWLVKGRP